MKTLKILLILISFGVQINYLIGQERKSEIEILVSRTSLDELEVTIKNASLESEILDNFQLTEEIVLKELKIIQTLDNQYYLLGFNSDKTKQYALDLKKEGDDFIHTRMEETHSCEVKKLDEEIFIVKENGQIAGCHQGNHTITIGGE